MMGFSSSNSVDNLLQYYDLNPELQWLQKKERRQRKSPGAVNAKSRRGPKLKSKSDCVAYCDDWSLISVVKGEVGKLVLRNSVSGKEFEFPSSKMINELNRFSKFIVACPPTQPDCTVLCFSNQHPFFCLFELKERCRRKPCLLEEYSGEIYDDVIVCRGNIYAVNPIGGLTEIEVKGLKISYHTLSDSYPTYTLPGKQRLVDASGELFLVQTFPAVPRRMIFKMDFSKRRWERVENLGDRVFFLTFNHSVSFSASEMRMRGNRIYFADEEGKALYLLDLEDESLTLSLNSPSSGTLSFSIVGRLPVLSIPTPQRGDESIIIQEEESNLDSTQRKGELEGNFSIIAETGSQFRFDLWRAVAYHLPLGKDYMNFRLVCRAWRSVAPPIHWTSDSVSVGSSTIQYPWLMFFQNKEKGVCKFFDPIENFTYLMNTPELSDCALLCSKDSWVLVCQGRRSVFLFEPFTRTKIQLPDLPSDYDFNGICISGSPASSDSAIFAILQSPPIYVSILYLPLSRKRWHLSNFQLSVPLHPSWTSPVFLNRSFYSLGQDGSLIQFSQKGKMVCQILGRPQWQLSSSSTMWRIFLVPFKDELISVCASNLGKVVCVSRWDFFSTKWIEIKNLGDGMLFACESTSLALATKHEAMKNKIYFPVFNLEDGNNVFYSLETSKYENFGSDHSSEDLSGTKEYLHSVWIQPQTTPTFR